MPNYSVNNLPSNKALGHLLNVQALGGWPRPSLLSKADGLMLIRNGLVTVDGKLTDLGERILDYVSTPMLPTPLATYNPRRGRNHIKGHTMHVGWSSDSTIWFYREGWNIFNPIQHCLAIDFSLVMFAAPSQQH